MARRTLGNLEAVAENWRYSNGCTQNGCSSRRELLTFWIPARMPSCEWPVSVMISLLFIMECLLTFSQLCDVCILWPRLASRALYVLSGFSSAGANRLRQMLDATMYRSEA